MLCEGGVGRVSGDARGESVCVGKDTDIAARPN